MQRLELRLSPYVFAAATAFALLLPGRAGAVVITNSVATYDASSNANVVDATATGSTGSAATFAALVSAAHAANVGGVVDFESANYVPTGDPAADTAYTFQYGAASTRSLGVTTSVTIDGVTGVNLSTGTVQPITGSGVLTNQATGTDVTFTFAPPAGHRLTDAAFTLLSRNNYGASGFDFTVTANFTGGGTQVATANISNVKAGDDTFFWFQAPATESISNIVVDVTSGTGSTPAFDDFGIITVIPEPASGALAAVAAAGLLARRRR